MAGIGFELKRLFAQRSAMGYFRAYSYTAIVTSGPFVLMTGMVLAIQQLLKVFDVSYAQTQMYIVSIIYPFIFSHIISSGFSIIITRYISDKLYEEEYEEIVPSLYGIIGITIAFASIIGSIFFLWAKLPWLIKLVTYVYYLQMIIIWLQSVYLSALKDYKKIIYAYLAGAAVSVAGVFFILYFQLMPPLLGSMLSMNVGALIMNVFLLAQIKTFFPKENSKPFNFIKYFDSHGSLFLVQLFYTAGIYIANIIMWFGPFGISISETYLYAPAYDAATFYAFLSILPVMIMFVVSVEASFYECYAIYFMYITSKGNFRDISEAREDLLRTMWSELRNIMEFQLVFTLIFLAMGNYLLPKVGLAYTSINIYNLLVLSAYGVAIMQVIITLLLYFEDRRGALIICSIFLVLNIMFNLISLYFGETTYGFGFFLAAFIGLIVSIFRLHYFSERIDYFVFCSRPVFHQHEQGVFHKLVQKLYPK